MAEQKVCSKCGLTKTYSEFVKHPACVGGVSSRCKACDKIYRDLHREEHIERCRQWRLAHPTYSKTNSKKYYESHKEELKEKATKWRRAHPELIREQRKRYHRKYRNDPVYLARRAMEHRKYMARMKDSPRLAANQAVNMAIRSGQLIRKPCEMCGATPADAHHHKGYDLAHWFDVQWLCQKHHSEAHGKVHWE